LSVPPFNSLSFKFLLSSALYNFFHSLYTIRCILPCSLFVSFLGLQLWKQHNAHRNSLDNRKQIMKRHFSFRGRRVIVASRSVRALSHTRTFISFLL
jgi:hypothetical protein